MRNRPIRQITIQQSVRKGRRRATVAGFFRRLFPRGGKGRPPVRRILSYAAIVLIALFFAGSIAVLGFIAWVANDLPDPNNISQRSVAQSTKIYDRTGEIVLYEVHGDEKRTLVDLPDVSPHIINATIAAEDKDFYTHRGFKVTGYARAFYKNLISGERGQGGSTITQQFVKNAVLSPEKTYTRKLRELVLAFEMERRFSKDEILKLYLNEIPYGPVIYGVQSAAESFFGKEAKDLTVSESAIIASVPKATTYFSPYGTHTDELLARAHSTIDTMADEGYITREEAEEAKADDVLSRLVPPNETILAPHFIFYVREILAEEFGEQMVERGGLRVVTTLDADTQRMAEESLDEQIEHINEWGGSTAALLSLDPRNGDILAMIGSADYFNDDINGKFNALLGKLQPGSSIKPAVYAAAFEKGYTPDTVVYDVVTDFNGYEPKNYDLKERGPVTLREALAGSLNVPAVKVLYLTGLRRFQEFAERLGYTTLSDGSRYGLSLVLGGAEVRPIEHISAFAAYANDGILHERRAILRVEDGEGKVLIDNTEERKGKRVIEKEIVRTLNGVLSDNAARAFAFGENNYLTLGGRPVAAKTGTTNDYKDAWTIGYTPSLVTGVWVGNAKGTEMKRGAGGSTVAAPLWNAFMRKALEGAPMTPFPPAEQVVTGKAILDGHKDAQVKVRIDTVTGKLATEYTPPDLIEEKGFGVPHSILFFIDKDDPRGPDPMDPSSDPLFDEWEAAVAAWAEGQDIELTPPPTEYDDVHVPENLPTVSLVQPRAQDVIPDRNMYVSVDASAPLGVDHISFALDGDEFGRFDSGMTRGTVSIPNRFTKGFHTLSATAYDPFGNRSSTDIMINLTADAGPLGVLWRAPYNGQFLTPASFPLNIRFSIDDVAGIASLQVVAIRRGSSEVDVIGGIDNPALPNMSVAWNERPEPGSYDIEIIATLRGGETGRERINVIVQ